MLKFYMPKILKFFIFVLLLTQTLISKEPTIAVLVDIESNYVQHFKIGNKKLECKPYGIIGLDELYGSNFFNSTCKTSILKFYKQRADLKYYVYTKLDVQQFYRLKIKDERCLISVSGEKSLSEFLLEEGLAVRKPLLRDKENEYFFYKSQLNAKMLQKGIWKENIIRECIANIYKK